MANNFNPEIQDKIGKRRFNGGIDNDPTYYSNVKGLQDRLLKNLPSNYTKHSSLNIGLFFDVIARELGFVQKSASDILDDRYHEETRIEYLFQVLGDSLFLGENSINQGLTDVSYREFLIKVRNAYFGGSRKANIERSVSDIIGIPVILKEAYLSLRKDNSSYTLKDTHRMFFDIFMDKADTSEIGLLLASIRFFIDLIKPAHVLYDTRLIWTEELYKENLCTPSYIETPITEVVYNPYKVFIVSYVADKIWRYSGTDHEIPWEEGVVASIDRTRNIIRLTDFRKLVYTVGTSFNDRDSDGSDTPINELDIQVGDDLRYLAVKDTSETSAVIQNDWQYTGIVTGINTNKELIQIGAGTNLVYNKKVYIYTRDGFGEYRINFEDLLVNDEIAFKADMYGTEVSFYNVPETVQDNYYKQFDREERSKPGFNENVKKEKDIQEGCEEGANVIVEDGVLKVVTKDPRFYKRANQKNFKAKTILRYSLIIGGVYQEQFSIDPKIDPILTEDQAKEVFEKQYGYDDLDNPDTEYEIKIARTGKLIEENSSSSVVQTVGDTPQICDRSSATPFLTMYEDIRRYCTWPDLKLTSGFFLTLEDFGPLIGDVGGVSVPGKFVISSDPNHYVMGELPLLQINGDIATKDDVTVYLDGVKVPDSVEYLDPWKGIVSLNFIPPFNTKLRVDYYYAGRYPHKMDHIVYNKSSGPSWIPESLSGYFSVLASGGLYKRLLWPFEVSETLYGDDLDYQVNKFPILGCRGNLASKENIEVSIGTKVVRGNLDVVSVNPDNTTDLLDPASDISRVLPGDTIVIDVANYLDRTLIYTVKEVDGQVIRIYSVFPSDIASSNLPYTVIHYDVVEDAVEGVRPLYGHIRINFIPPLDTVLKFTYNYTHLERNYVLLPDPNMGSDSDAYGGVDYISDAFYGPRVGYTLLADPDMESNSSDPVLPFEDILEIGYRYRAFNLANSSVLNSRETLSLNEGSKKRAMTLNNYSLMFSHEHKDDTDPYIVLNDKYLEKDLDPLTKLKKGIPIFPKTFTDDTHYRHTDRKVETETLPVLTEGKDLVSGFTIINSDESGLIDYNSVTDANKNKRVTLYSNLKVVEFSNGGYDAPLSSLCEGDKTIPFNMCYVDEYYPNRELRLNDYYDFINQVPVENKTGKAYVLNKSKIIKTSDNNFLAIRRGDDVTFKGVEFTEWSPTEGHNVEVFKDVKYTIVDIIDYQTAKLHAFFDGKSGEYSYDLERSGVVGVDVNLVDVNRSLIINGDIGYTYGLPQSVLKALPGYGITGMHFELNFPDPDPDPTPTDYLDAIDLGLTGPVFDPNPITEEVFDIYKVPTPGSTGFSRSFSETEYRVRWRNWDQELIWVTFPGRFEEDPLFLDSDIGEGIRKSFWNVNRQEIVHLHFFGSVLITSELKYSSVAASSYPEGLMPLTQEQVDRIQYYLSISQDPATSIPEYNLNEAYYNVREQIAYEVLIDDSIKTTEVQELVPV